MVHTRQLRQRWCWTSGSVRGPRLMSVTDLHWYHFCEPITEFSAIPWCHHRFGVKGPWSLHRILWDQVGIFTLELSWFFQGHGAEAFWMLINWSYFSRSLSLSLSQTYFLLCLKHTHTHTHTLPKQHNVMQKLLLMMVPLSSGCTCCLMDSVCPKKQETLQVILPCAVNYLPWQARRVAAV